MAKPDWLEQKSRITKKCLVVLVKTEKAGGPTRAQAVLVVTEEMVAMVETAVQAVPAEAELAAPSRFSAPLLRPRISTLIPPVGMKGKQERAGSAGSSMATIRPPHLTVQSLWPMRSTSMVPVGTIPSLPVTFRRPTSRISWAVLRCSA